MGSVWPLEKCSSPSTVASTGISLFFCCLGAVGSSWLEHWRCIYFTSCSLTLAPSHETQLPCCSFHTDNPQEPFLCCWIVVTGWQWEPWLEPQPCGEGRDPSPAPGVCWASPCGSDFWNLVKNLIIRQAFVFFLLGYKDFLKWPLSVPAVYQISGTAAGLEFCTSQLMHLYVVPFTCVLKASCESLKSKTSLLWQLMH